MLRRSIGLRRQPRELKKAMQESRRAAWTLILVTRPGTIAAAPHIDPKPVSVTP